MLCRLSKRSIFAFSFVSCVLISSCSTKPTQPTEHPLPSAKEISRSKTLKPGWLVIIQGPTGAHETSINILAPRLKSFQYTVKDDKGIEQTVQKYETVYSPPQFYKVDKIFLSGLKPGVTYKLEVTDNFKSSATVVDHREFTTLDVDAKQTTFATMSCMADDWRFEDVIDPIWNRLIKAKPDFLLMNGDVVYVDSFAFVEREKATEYDIWQRYISSLNRIPVYHTGKLIPIFASWDDHDFGTNDGDRTFHAKDPAQKVFKAFFGGKDIPGVFENGPGGVATAFKAFGQHFIMMDDRTYRQPNKNQKTKEPYGHWGEKQHLWMLSEMKKDPLPTWLVNGNQIFNGKALDFKEALEMNHPANYDLLLKDLRPLKQPIVFVSGDIHFSEIMKIPAERLGFETYELTSSAMHSYSGDGWENPLRIPGASTIEFNYMLVTATAHDHGLNVDVRAQGLAPGDLFRTQFEVHNK